MRSLRPLAPLLLLLTLSACGGLRLRNPQVLATPDLRYRPGADPKHLLDLYTPRDARAPVPAVLFVHGGFWRNQDRRYLQPFTGLHGNVGVALARRGIAVAVQSYRLFPKATLDEQLADVLAAARWLRDHAPAHSINSDCLFLAGYSAGGHLVTLLTLDDRRLSAAGLPPQLVRGTISLSGVLDIPLMARQQPADFNRDLTTPLFGADPAAQASLSPVNYLRPDAPPLLLLTAERDYPFVRESNRAAVAQLQRLGAPVQSGEIGGIDHADMILDINGPRDRVSDTIAAFIQQRCPR